MRDDTKVIQGDTDDFVIKVNDDEIPVCTGEFYRMRRIGAFVKEYEDSEDTIKLYGITSDGKMYVSEKDDFDKTDEEFDDWAKRAGCDNFKDFKVLSNDKAQAKWGKYSLNDGMTVT